MATLLPTKMSLFENVTSLTPSSYMIGLDMYSGQLANVKITSSIAGYELSRRRWILNPPVSASDDPRGDDGAESYNLGQYWVKSGSVWLQLVVTGSNSGGTISSSFQLSDGGGEAFGPANNVTFGRANIGAITGSKLSVSTRATIGSDITNEHFVTGSLHISGALSVTDKILIGKQTGTNGTLDIIGDVSVTGSLVVGKNATSAYGYFTNAFGIGRIGMSSSSFYIGGQYGMNTVLQANNSNIIFIKDNDPKVDISGSVFITGSLNVSNGINGTLNGTASYALYAKSNNVYNVKDYGAKGDGSSNDTTPIQNAINAVQAAGYGTVYFPDGTYLITGSLTLPYDPQCDIELEGDGSTISAIKQTSNTHAIYFNFSNGSGYENQYQVAIRGLAFKTSGQADTAIYVTYGTIQYSQHQNISVDIEDVHVYSDGSNYWDHGIVLESAWNFRITNTMVIGKTIGNYPYNGTGLELRRMCVNGSINQSQFNFWKTGIFVNTVDYSSTGMNTEGLFLDQIYMVPVHYGVYVKGNKSFYNPPFNVDDWAGRPIAGRMVLFSFGNSHVDSRDSGSALLLENVQSHYISNNLLITDGTGSVIYGSNAHEGTFIGNTFFNAGVAPSLYIGGYSGSANIVNGNVFRGGSTHVLLESSSLYNKVYGNVAYNALNISITDLGTSNLTGSVGN